MNDMTPAQAFDLAVAHHRAGRLGEAEQIYRQILSVEACHAGALHHLGLLACQLGQAAAGVELIERALAGEPRNAAAWNNFGEALRLMSRTEAALRAFERSLELDATCAEAWNNLGNVLDDLGRMGEAEAAFRKAVSLRPGYADAHNNLGSVLRSAGRLDEAAAAFRKAGVLAPEDVVPLVNLGALLHELGQAREALEVLMRAVQMQPASPEAQYNLGNVLRTSGHEVEAARAYRRAAALRPELAAAHYNLGLVLAEQGKMDEALEAYGLALDREPGNADALCNAGMALAALGRHREAHEMLERALRARPHFAMAQVNLANLLKDGGRLDEALAGYERALEWEPGNALAHSNLLYTLQFHPGRDAAAILERSREWDRMHARGLAGYGGSHSNAPEADRRLRIGYVSPEFRAQAEAFFVVPLLEGHDHGGFEIHCYYSAGREDAISGRHRRAADVWHEVAALDDASLARRIYEDRIDILVDLTMHMAGSRLLAFARRPAPVQVTWLAYPGTTGLGAMDYRISDHFMESGVEAGPRYSEETVCLPESWCCFDPLWPLPAVGGLPCGEAGPVTFGSLNNFCKLNESVLALWAQVLGAVGASRLLLLAPEGEPRERVWRFLEGRGIGRGRVEFVSARPRAEYLELYRLVDIALDPFPYNGITTTCDALLMGVPVVSRVGERASARAGLSLLSVLGRPEWAARSDADFVATAAALAADRAGLARLRAGLRAQMQASALSDGRRFARHLEAAYRAMWRRWCEHQGGASGSGGGLDKLEPPARGGPAL